MSDPNAAVWAIQQEGNYYCSGSVLAGRKPGKFMKQADALTLGYQPALGHYCGSETESGGAPGGNFSAFFVQLGQSGGRILSKLFNLSRSLFSDSYSQSAAARPLTAVAPGAPAPRHGPANSPNAPGIFGSSVAASTAQSTGSVAANSSSAAVPVPGR